MSNPVIAEEEIGMRTLDVDAQGLLALAQTLRAEVCGFGEDGLVEVKLSNGEVMRCEILMTSELCPLALQVADRVLVAPPDESGGSGCILGRLGAQAPARVASGSLVLRCGKATITLREDGKILIRGTDVVSIASRSNRVKGATVEIN